MSCENLKKTLFKNLKKIQESISDSIFKQYVFGFFFYKYISEDITEYINKDENDKFDYKTINDDEISEENKNNLIKEKGFFIYPSQLFINVYERTKNDPKDLNEIVGNIFRDIESTSIGFDSEKNVKGIFGQVDFNSQNLGATVATRNKLIFEIMSIIHSIELNQLNKWFCNIYEDMIINYMSTEKKYFTPQEVSRLLTLLAIGNKKEIKNVYDPACGSGSLLIQAQKILGNNIKDGFFGQDNNYEMYNICRMNMFLHNVDYSNFNIQCEDTLVNPHLDHINKKFEVIVSNPPYSEKWIGNNNPTLINDDRYSPAGVLAPKSKADYAFIMHSLHLLDTNGVAAIACFAGAFYRGGPEAKIRKYLIDNNFVDLIIALPSKLFDETSINTNIMVLSKSKTDNKVMFIDASELYVKETNQNKLSEDNIQEIIKTFLNKEKKEHFSKLVEHEEIVKNNYDLSVKNYVQNEDINKKIINIKEINKEIKKISIKNNELKKEIDLIVEMIENKKN